MPVFGEKKEVLAISLSVSIDSDVPDSKSEVADYHAPAGYKIMGVREHLKNEQGHGAHIYGSSKYTNSALTHEDFLDKLRKITGDFFGNVISHEKIKSQYEYLNNGLWADLINGKVDVYSKGGSQYSVREVDYYAQLVYVGRKDEGNKLLNEWLQHVAVEKTFSYYDFKDKLTYLNTAYHSVEGKVLMMNNIGGNTNSPSTVAFDTGHIPSSSIATFKTRISSIGSTKTCEAVIWALPLRGFPDEKQVSGLQEVGDWTELSVKMNLFSDDKYLRFEIFDHDNGEGNTVIDLEATIITISKLFYRDPSGEWPDDRPFTQND